MTPPDEQTSDRVDDGSISDDERLWRRLYPDWIEWDEPGGPRCRSLAFLDRRSGEVSVHRAILTTHEQVLRDHPEQSLAEIEARVPRALGHKVVPDPEEEDPSHAVICPPSKPSKGDARKMAQQSRLVVVRERNVLRE